MFCLRIDTVTQKGRRTSSSSPLPKKKRSEGHQRENDIGQKRKLGIWNLRMKKKWKQKFEKKERKKKQTKKLEVIERQL